MTEEEKAEQFANNGYALGCTKTPFESAKDGYLAGLHEGQPKWHKVADGKLPELDKKVWVIRSADDDLPMVAKRHVYTSYGRTEWEWKCYWGSGFDLKQNEIFAWCEIPTFKE